MAGVAKIIDKDSGVIKSQTEWGLIIALFRATVAHPEASKVTLAIVQKMTAASSMSDSNGHSGPGVSIDNFGGVVALLDEFATAAGAAVLGRQQRRNTQQPTLCVHLGSSIVVSGLMVAVPRSRRAWRRWIACMSCGTSFPA